MRTPSELRGSLYTYNFLDSGDSVTIVQQATRERDRKVFVMCHHGISRSASMAYFLLRASGLEATKAESIVRHARPSAKIVRAHREAGERYLRH